MDLRSTIAALPWLRKAWRLLPGPLKLPLLAIALFMWWRHRGQDDEPGQPGTDGSGRPRTDGSGRPGADQPRQELSG